MNRKKADKKNFKKLIAALCAVLAVSVIIAAVLIYLLVIREQSADTPAEEIELPVITESEKESEIPENLGTDVVEHIITAGNAVDEAYKSRPESHELTDENAADFAAVESCEIEAGTGKIAVTITGDGIPASDDKYYYLFALNTYDSGITAESEAIAKEYKDNTTKMTVALNYNRSNSRLYKKFVAAIKIDGKFVQVSAPEYITNPEVIAKYGSVYQQPSSKKGLLVDPNKLRGNELDDLGVKQAAYNIPIARLLGPTTSSAYPTINYTYNGKTYTFNGQVVAEYDLVFSTLTSKGICTTAILLNNYSSSYPQLIHPDARSGSTAPYYMFNGAEESGVEYMAAVGTFLAERYSDSRHGRVSNWVIANEINARKEWNYMAKTDIETYVEEYAKAFRVFYTAIKSVSSSARVYISIDQQWDRNLKNNPNYDGRDIVDVFNRNIASKGNIDWGLAQHPYNVPLTEARIWKSSKYVTHSVDTSMITMANIEVLTNYMEQEQLLNPQGEVRSILLSEQGYTSQAGEAVQAAAFAYAYYRAEANPHIDGFLLNRETDAPEEVSQGLSFGLNHAGGGHKQIYNVFKYIDTAQHAEYTEFAKSIIGISGWSEIMY
ncbi:MAG: hypothetical protein J6C64_11815 [Lachnospiraceae bacterium]|nr:hypothetical protein [Lachnospiraceae bacterium]